MDFEKIKELSLLEKKSLLERFLKLSEETGELALEILIKEKSSGIKRKNAGIDGIKGECIDVILVALSIYFKEGGSITEFQNLINNKSNKWHLLQAKD